VCHCVEIFCSVPMWEGPYGVLFQSTRGASIATCLLPVVCNMKEVIVFIENIFGSRYGIYLAETIAGTYRTFIIG